MLLSEQLFNFRNLTFKHYFWFIGVEIGRLMVVMVVILKSNINIKSLFMLDYMCYRKSYLTELAFSGTDPLHHTRFDARVAD